MSFPRSTFAAVSAITIFTVSTPLEAAPVTVNGASFNAPDGCQTSGSALVCKVDGQQMELWVNRRLVASDPDTTETLAQRMAWLQGTHDAAVKNIMRSTFNDKLARFDSYGKYPALGSAMPGKGSASSPTVRFASVLHDGEYWEFLEVAASRSPAVEVISTMLQKSLSLPSSPLMSGTSPSATGNLVTSGPPPPASPTTAPTLPDIGSSPLAVTFDSRLLTFEMPGYLAATVEQNQDDQLRVSFRHKTRKTGGPAMQLVVQPPSSDRTVTSLETERRTAVAASMSGQPSVVDIGKLGPIVGKGFAMIGTTRGTSDAPAVEMLETVFVAAVSGGMLELRLSAEQQYAGEAQSVWAMIASSLRLNR